ncbi:hypothetical protein Ecol01_04380 [Escherichia coli]
MLPEQFPRLRVMYRLALACETSLTVITVMHRHPVAFAEMADFCQPAVVVIPPLLCRFAVHRAVCDTVRCIVVPEGDKPLILALREFPGQVITVTLRPPVKAALLYQAVKHIPAKFCMATVLVGQADDTSRCIVFHAARQTTLCGADGLSPRIVQCLTPVAVRGNDGGQVACGVVFILRFTALRVLPTDQLAARIIGIVRADAFLTVYRHHLTKAVVFVMRFIS